MRHKPTLLSFNMRKLLIILSFLLCSFSSIAAEQVITSAQKASQNLIDIYQKALSKDPVLASAFSANQAAQELTEQGKALYRPTINLVAGANTQSQDFAFTGAARPNPANPLVVFQNQQSGVEKFEQRRYGIEARQPIYRKQNLLQIDQAQTQVDQADKQLLQSQQNLILRTTQSYFDVLIAQDRIDLINAQKAAILKQLEQAKANFEVGTATITDVNEAQARYDLVLAQEVASVNEFEIAKRGVELITGEIPDKLASAKTDISVEQLKDNIQDWQQTARENNLNIRIQEDALKLAEQEEERAKAGHLPTLDAVASYTDSYANGGINTDSSRLKNAIIGIELQIPLYQGGAISSRARQATLNKQRARNDVEIARRQTDLETQRAYLNLSTSIAQVKALEQALISTQSQLDSTKLGYEVGVRTSVDVLNVQQQFYSAKRDLLESRYNYLVNIIRLKSATGIVAEADLQEINRFLDPQVSAQMAVPQ
jgi:outer membrane protein